MIEGMKEALNSDQTFNGEENAECNLWFKNNPPELTYAAQYLLSLPLFLSDYPLGLHTFLELIDVITLIGIVRSLGGTPQKELTTWRYLPWNVNVQYFTFGFLVIQMVVWIIPVVYLSATPSSRRCDKKTQSDFKKRVLIACCCVELFTDFPELVTLIAWGPKEGDIIVILVLIFDLVMSFYSIVFSPIFEIQFREKVNGPTTTEGATEGATEEATEEATEDEKENGPTTTEGATEGATEEATEEATEDEHGTIHI